MGVPEPTGTKITVVTNTFEIALHRAKHDQAKRVWTEVATNNFNSVAFAMVRAEARKKTGL